MSHGQNKRERLLIVFAAIMGGIIVIYLLNDLYGQKMTALMKKRKNAIEVNEKFEQSINRLPLFEERLNEFATQSLPIEDRRASSSRYQNWLVGIVDRAGLKDRSVDPLSIQEEKNGRDLQYCVFSFMIRGRGNLQQVSELLKMFYEVDQHHAITAITIKPAQSNSAIVDLTLEVSALGLLETAPSETPWMTKKATPVPRETLDTIIARAIFSNYSPPPAEIPERVRENLPTPPAFDARPFCSLNGLAENHGTKEAFIEMRTEGKKLWIKEGQSFQVGTISCLLTKINLVDECIDIEAGKLKVKCRIYLGKSFADAEPIERS